MMLIHVIQNQFQSIVKPLKWLQIRCFSMWMKMTRLGGLNTSFKYLWGSYWEDRAWPFTALWQEGQETMYKLSKEMLEMRGYPSGYNERLFHCEDGYPLEQVLFVCGAPAWWNPEKHGLISVLTLLWAGAELEVPSNSNCLVILWLTMTS